MASFGTFFSACYTAGSSLSESNGCPGTIPSRAILSTIGASALFWPWPLCWKSAISAVFPKSETLLHTPAVYPLIAFLTARAKDMATDENFIVAANHFPSDEMKNHNARNYNIFSSDTRFKTAYNALKNKGHTDGIEYAEGILSGKYGFMCQYDKQLNFDTIWSSVFDISNNRIYRAEGNPSRARFKKDTRSKLLD